MNIVEIGSQEFIAIEYICEKLISTQFPYFWSKHLSQLQASYQFNAESGISEDILQPFLSRLAQFLANHENHEWDEFYSVLRKAEREAA